MDGKEKKDITPCKFGSLLSLMKEAGCSSLEKAATYTHQVQDPLKKMEEALVQATNESTDDAISETDYIWHHH